MIKSPHLPLAGELEQQCIRACYSVWIFAGRKGMGGCCCSCRLPECRRALPGRRSREIASRRPSTTVRAPDCSQGKKARRPKSGSLFRCRVRERFPPAGGKPQASCWLAPTNRHRLTGTSATGRDGRTSESPNGISARAKGGWGGPPWLVGDRQTARPCRRWAASDSGHSGMHAKIFDLISPVPAKTFDLIPT